MYELATKPEQITAMLGWHSVQPGWSSVIRIGFSNQDHHRIYWANRHTATEAKLGGYRNLEVKDRRINPAKFHYDTDRRAS